MSDPLTIPDDKRADGHVSLFDPPSKRHWSSWIFLAVLLGLNVWFDYYHFPLGILLDIIVLVVILAKI